MFRLVTIALILAFADAFAPAFVRTPPLNVRQVVLSDEETQAILQSSNDCIDSECSVDDVALLIKDLKEQERILSVRLTNIMNHVAHLQHANSKKNRKTDEVRSFVKDLLSVFGSGKPSGKASSMGFTDGPFDSYDILGVKPWKKPDNKD